MRCGAGDGGGGGGWRGSRTVVTDVEQDSTIQWYPRRAKRKQIRKKKHCTGIAAATEPQRRAEMSDGGTKNARVAPSGFPCVPLRHGPGTTCAGGLDMSPRPSGTLW